MTRKRESRLRTVQADEVHIDSNIKRKTPKKVPAVDSVDMFQAEIEDLISGGSKGHLDRYDDRITTIDGKVTLHSVHALNLIVERLMAINEEFRIPDAAFQLRFTMDVAVRESEK